MKTQVIQGTFRNITLVKRARNFQNLQDICPPLRVFAKTNSLQERLNLFNSWQKDAHFVIAKRLNINV